MRQKRSSPSIPGSPIHAHDLKYRHSPCTFWRIFLHIVALTPGKCSFGSTCLQSVIDRVLLSNGSAHLGSESLRHSQHLIARPRNINLWLELLFFTLQTIKILLATIWSNNFKFHLFVLQIPAKQWQRLLGEFCLTFSRTFQRKLAFLLKYLWLKNKINAKKWKLNVCEWSRCVSVFDSSWGLGENFENSKNWKLSNWKFPPKTFGAF